MLPLPFTSKTGGGPPSQNLLDEALDWQDGDSVFCVVNEWAFNLDISTLSLVNKQFPVFEPNE